MKTASEDPTSVLPANWHLPQVFHDRLGKHAGAQRAMSHDGHLLLIVHDVPKPGDPERFGLFFWRSPEGEWRSTLGAGFFRLVGLIDRYAQRIDVLEEKIARAHDATSLFEVMREGSPLRRSVANLAHALQQARESVGGRDLIAQRDRAQQLVLASELLLTDAKQTLDYRMARQAEEQSQADRAMAANGERLNRLAALFLPLTLLASLFGMNLPSGLETSSPVAFWALVAGGLMLGYALGRVAGRGATPPPTDPGRSSPGSSVSGTSSAALPQPKLTF